ncbi:hypothetical protein ABZ934_07160 [Streptomyces sp. NPDC046557]|uniref:hypothetical protein n=1 Tax=Streptomyces sp. NPDC046557 TaxID=3155372 RepID=UPI0033C8F5C7
MSHSVPSADLPLARDTVLVVDATIGIGRVLTRRLCLAGASVAVVGVGHRERADDAAANAAFLCKELVALGLVALPYRADVDRPETVRELPAQIAADLGPVTAAVVVLAPASAGRTLVELFRGASGLLSGALPPGARHIEVRLSEDVSHEELAESVLSRLLASGPR